MLVWYLIGSRKCLHCDFKRLPSKENICGRNTYLLSKFHSLFLTWGTQVCVGWQCAHFPVSLAAGMRYGSGQWDAGRSLWGRVPSNMKRQSVTRRKHFTPSAFTLLPTWNISMRLRDAASMLRPRGDKWEGEGRHAESGVKKSLGSPMVLQWPGYCPQTVYETNNVLQLS